MEKFLRGPRLTLRPVRLSDAPAIQHHITKKSISRWMLSLPSPYPPNGALQYIRKTRRQMKKGTYYGFAILLNTQPLPYPSRATKRPPCSIIGTIGLREINTIHKNAKLGYWLAQKYWGRGLMSEALQLILRFGFRTLGLHRIYASAFAHNTASRRVLEKAGFVKEGLQREQQFWEGRWRDRAEYGLLQSEWKQLKEIPRKVDRTTVRHHSTQLNK